MRCVSSKIFLSSLMALFISACGGTASSSNETEFIEGYLIDSAVQGVEYRCGDKIGITGEDGQFICSSLPITFYVGSIEIGSIAALQADKKVFPQDIIGVDRNETGDDEVIKIAMLLQSLDSDGNTSNGITITSETRQRLTREEPTVLRETLLAALEEEYPEINFIDSEKALDHLNFSLNGNVEEENSENQGTNSVGGESNSTSSNTETNTEQEQEDDFTSTQEETQGNAADTNQTDTEQISEAVTLPTGYSYGAINNTGTVVEGQVADYRVVLYSNYEEQVNGQSLHHGIVVKVNEESSEVISIQATYIGHTIVAALYDASGALVKVSDITEVTDDTPIVFIELSI